MSLENTVNRAADHGRSALTRVDYLDGWRGMAILLVLMAHFFHVREINVGRMGVDVFFVLSGMLMSNILFVKKVPLITFYKRRISRILPVFFIFITTVSLCSLIFGLSNEHTDYLYNLFFLRAYYPESPDLWHTGLPVGHLWSLNVEEHSYIILSLIALVATIAKKAYFPILIIGFGAIVLQYIYITHPDSAPAHFYLRTEIVASFLMVSAGYFLIKNRFENLIPCWAPVASLALALLCYSPYAPHWSAKWSMAPFLLAFSVNHLNLTPQTFRTMLNFLPLRLIGIWSFSIYLWQQPFYYYGTKFGDAFHFAGPVLALIAICVGALSFYFIENPIRKYLNNKW